MTKEWEGRTLVSSLQAASVTFIRFLVPPVRGVTEPGSKEGRREGVVTGVNSHVFSGALRDPPGHLLLPLFESFMVWCCQSWPLADVFSFAGRGKRSS